MAQISCQNEFCIYQKHGNCLLESIQLDIQGNCMNSIYISIEEVALKNLKENLLNDLES